MWAREEWLGGACLAPAAGYPQPMWATMFSNSSVRPVRMRHAFAVCASLLLAACASKYSQVPARLDLAPYGRIALVTFAADRPNDPMSTLATQQFAEALLANQNGVELLRAGINRLFTESASAASDAVALAQALGKQKNVPAVFVGYAQGVAAEASWSYRRVGHERAGRRIGRAHREVVVDQHRRHRSGAQAQWQTARWDS